MITFWLWKCYIKEITLFNLQYACHITSSGKRKFPNRNYVINVSRNSWCARQVFLNAHFKFSVLVSGGFCRKQNDAILERGDRESVSHQIATGRPTPHQPAGSSSAYVCRADPRCNWYTVSFSTIHGLALTCIISFGPAPPLNLILITHTT